MAEATAPFLVFGFAVSSPSSARQALYSASLGLPGRVDRHREGLIKGFTSRYGVTRLVHFEMFGDMIGAIARERPLKKCGNDE